MSSTNSRTSRPSVRFFALKRKKRRKKKRRKNKDVLLRGLHIGPVTGGGKSSVSSPTLLMTSGSCFEIFIQFYLLLSVNIYSCFASQTTISLSSRFEWTTT